MTPDYLVAFALMIILIGMALAFGFMMGLGFWFGKGLFHYFKKRNQPQETSKE
jgi:uncharacterized protein YneF (UPF0154 family)